MGSYEERKRKILEENGIVLSSAKSVSSDSSTSSYEERKKKILEDAGVQTAVQPVRPVNTTSVADKKARMQVIIGETGTALKAAKNAVSAPIAGNEYKSYQNRIKAAENAVRAAQAQEAMNPNIHGNLGYNFQSNTAKAQADLKNIKDEYTQFKTDKYSEKQNKRLSELTNKAGKDPDFAAMVKLGEDRYNLVQNAKKDNKFRITFNPKGDKGMGDMFKLGNFTDEEKQTYYYLLGKEGWNAADVYEKLMERTVNKRIAQKEYDYIKDVSKDNKVAGIGLNTAAGLMGGAGLLKTVGQSVGNAMRPDEEYIPADVYHPAYSANLMQKAATEGVTGDIESPLGKFFAETGLSTVNFLTNLAAGGGWTTLALMGSNAGGQSAYDALGRGATVEQAAKVGLMSAAAEMAFERIPVGTASDLFTGKFKDSFGKAMLQMAMEEGFEEVATEYTNLLGDNIIMGDKSEFNQFVKEQVANGATEEEAKKAAILEFAVKRPAVAFAGGAVSGAGIGAAGGAYGGTNNVLPSEIESDIVSAIMESNNVSESEARQMLDNALNEGATVSKNATVENEAKTKKEYPPYTGEVPIQSQQQGDRIDIPRVQLRVAADNKINAEAFSGVSGKGVTTLITDVYKKVFADMKGKGKPLTVPVKGVTFKGQPYDVDVYNGMINKIAGGEVDALKFAVIESLPDIIREARYVKSSAYDTTFKNKNTRAERYDYFETPITINGANYVVAFDVAAEPTTNRYRTHRVINEISLTKTEGSSLARYASGNPRLSGFDNSISENGENINTFSAENSGNVIGNGEYGINPMSDLRSDNAQRLQLGQDMMRAQRAYQDVLQQWGLSDAEQGTLNYVISQTMAARNAANGAFDSLSYAKDLLNNLPGFEYANKFKLENELLPSAVRYNELRTDYGRQSGALKTSVKGLAQQAAEKFDLAEDKHDGTLFYDLETDIRNFEDAFEKNSPETGKWFVENYSKPVRDNNAEAERFRDAEFRGMKALNIDTGKKRLFHITFENQAGHMLNADLNEDGIVQAYGEKLISDADLEALKDNKGNAIDAEKIRNAVKWISAEYKKIIDSVNNILMEYGYDPVPERQNYFPHWSEPELTGLKGALSELGIDFSESNLPTSIAGLTKDFRPGKQWVGNFLQRKGADTNYGAVRGMQKYIYAVSEVLYHTGDVQRFRALENAIRARYSSEGVSERIQEEYRKIDSGEITFEKGMDNINKIQEDSPLTKMNGFVQWLQEYTNLLAGKKSKYDRGMESTIGRKFLSIADSVNKRFAGNVLGFNFSSPFTNFIPFTQADISVKNKIRGFQDTVQNSLENDGLMDKSTFYTNRIGAEPVYKTGLQTYAEKSMFLMELCDRVTVESLIRGRYYDNIAKGMDEVSAMADADDHVARVVADRSKGTLPVLIQAKNPILKLFTMFQTEVNNQFRYMFKDIPRANRDKAVGAVIASLMKLFVGAFAYNEMFEKVLGRRPAFDPIDIMTAAIGRFSGWERNNLFDVLGGDELFEEKPMDKGTALWDTLGDIGEEVPLLGNFLGGGRIPVTDAIPNVKTIIDNGISVYTGKSSPEKASEKIRKEVMKPIFYLIPPAGGIAGKKAWEGLRETARGGSYIHNNKGDELLRYPIENPTAGDYVKNALLGRTASEGYKTWKKYGFKNLSASETANYHKIVEAGMSYDQFMKYKYAFSTGEATKEEKAHIIQSDKDLSVKQKKALSEVLLNTTSFTPDYSKSGEDFEASLMRDAMQRAYKACYNDVKDLAEFKAVYPILTKGKDAEKLEKLLAMGFKDYEAENLLKSYKNREKGGD